MAAGSRQQSRFIAMISNYDKTLELIDDAYNSTGAAQEQFEKTLDSLQSKLEQLKNAWDQFTMGIVNSDAVKASVDSLTQLLTVVNNLVSSLSGGNGLTKTVLSLASVLGGLKLGKGVFNGLFGNDNKRGLLGAFFGKNKSPFINDKGDAERIGDNLVSGIKDSFQKHGFGTKDGFKGLFGETAEIPIDFSFKKGQDFAEQIKSLTDEQKSLLKGTNFLDSQDVTITAPNGVQGIEAAKHLKEVMNASDLDTQIQLMDQYGMKVEVTDSMIEKLAKTTDTKFTVSTQKVANALGIAGIALQGFSGYLKNLGMDEASKTVSSFGTALMTLPAILSVVNTALSLFSATAAMAGGPVAMGIAASIAAIIGIVGAISSLADTSSKLERLTEQTEQAKEAASQAQSEYESLKNTLDEIGNTNPFEGLVKGSLEWNEQLIKSNQQVLDLIDKYPELAQYMSVGENGELVISDEGKNTLLERQQQAAKNAQTTYAQSARQESQEKYETQIESALNKASDSAQYVYNNEDARQQLYDAYNEGTLDIEKVVDIMKNNNMDNSYNEITGKNISQEVLQLINDLEGFRTQNEASQKTYTDLLAAESNLPDNIAATLIKTTELKDSITDNEISTLATTLKNGEFSNIDTSKTGKELMQDILTKAGGYSQDQVSEMDVSALRGALTAFYNGQESSKRFDEFAQKNYSEVQQNQINKYLGSGSDFTRKDTKQSLTDYLGNDQEALERLAEALNMSSDSLVELADAAQQAATNSFTESENSISNQSAKDLFNLYSQEMTAGQASDFSKNLNNISTTAGGSTVIELKNILAAMNDFNGKNPEKMIQILDSLENVNFKNMGSIRSWIDLLKGMGYDFPIKQTQEWIDKLKEASGALEVYDSTDVFSEYAKAQTLLNSLKENGSSSISEEDKESLVKYGIDAENFQKNLDGTYQYLGGTNEQLISTLQELIGVLNGNTIEQLKQQIQLGQNYQNQMEANGGNMDVISQEEGVTGKMIADWMSNNQINTVADSNGQIYNQSQVLQLDDTSAQALAQAITSAVNNLQQNQQYLQEAKGVGTSGEVKLIGGTQNQIAAAATREATQAGVSADEVADMAEYLMLTNKALEAEKGLAYQISARNAIFNQGFQEIANSYKDWTELIDETSGKIKIEGAEDAKIYNDLKESVGKMVGFNVSDEFLQQADNLELLKRAAQGSEEALNSLIDNANMDDWINNMSLDRIPTMLTDAKGQVINFADFLGNLDLPDLEPGMDLSNFYDGTDALIGVFNDLLDKSQITVEEADKLFSQLGFEPEWGPGETTSVNWVAQLPTVTWNNGNSSNPESRPLMGAFTPKVTNSTQPFGSATLSMPSLHIKSLKRTGPRKLSGASRSAGAANAPKSSGGGGGGGGGGGSQEKKWENPYDELYNLTEKINEALRQREKLERNYDRILEKRGATFRELRDNQNAQLKSLEEEIKMQKELSSGRLNQINKLGSKTYQDSDGNEKSFSSWGATNYAHYDQEKGTIVIDWGAIDKVTDENKGGAIEAYISKLEEFVGEFEETEKTIEDMQDTIEEIKKQNMDDYLDFEQSVYDALVNQRQKEIDNFQSLSDSISEANIEILDTMRESIDLERQIRDNTKTEEDINEKEARLAFLRRDTSNANLLEIKQLEEELSDARESYGDSLIDQQLDKISKQNEDAQEARTKQIELMQAQLDYASENGEFWQQAYELIQTGFASDGSLNQASQLWNLLKEDQGWKAMSKFGQMDWQKTISQSIIAASHGYANWNMYEAENVTKHITGNGSAGQVELNYDSKAKQWKDSSGNIYKDVDFDSNTNRFTYGSVKYVNPPKPDNSGNNSGKSQLTDNIKRGVSAAIWNGGYGWGYDSTRSARLKEVFGTNDIQDKYVNKGIMTGYTGSLNDYSYENMKKKFKKYKTGGMADFTGPAWLDGTKTKPELILNAQDTQNFIELKNILSSLLSANNTAGDQKNKGGDNYFDIQVSVGEIGSDYDVESAIEKIKKEIYDNAAYRNVNAINFLR